MTEVLSFPSPTSPTSMGDTTTTAPSSDLFVDRYSPSSLDELVGNTRIVDKFKSYLEEKSFPNIILVGPPGSGKNTLVRLFTQQFLGQLYQTHCMVIYGALYRGRSIISSRNEKTAGSKSDKVGGPSVTNFIKKSLRPREVVKIIVIHDFDYITDDTQMSLRRLIEINHQKCRFILIANELNNIVEPIQSRCNIFRLELLEEPDIQQCLEQIADRADIKVNPEIMQEIVLQSDNNIRAAINTLQLLSFSQDLTVEQLYTLINIPVRRSIQTYFECCMKGDESGALEQIDGLLANGFSVVDLFDLLEKCLKSLDIFTGDQREDFIEILSNYYLLSDTTLTVNNLYHLTYALLTHDLE